MVARASARAPATDYDGPYKAMGQPEQLAYQVHVLAEFHKRASLNSSPDDDPDDYLQHGLARLFEIARDLQDRQPVELGRTPHNYVMNEQKRGFVEKVLQSLRGEESSTGYLSSLWELPRPAGDGWVWYQDHCYFAPGSDPGLTIVDITVDHGLDDLFAGFERKNRQPYLDITTSEPMVDSDSDEDEDEADQDDLRASVARTRSPSLFVGQGAAFDFSFDFGGGDFGGGFGEGEIGELCERTSARSPSWQAVHGLDDRAHDLGIGTSAQGAAMSAALGAMESARAGSVGGESSTRGSDGRWAKKRRRDEGGALAQRRPKKARSVEPLAPLETDERVVDDDLPLAHVRPARRRSKVIQKFTRTRTTFAKRDVVPKPANPFDEERLAEHFPETSKFIDPDKVETAPRRTYLLDKFWVHKRVDPTALVPLERLLRSDGQALPDVIIVGLARPHDPLDDLQHAESRRRVDRADVVEAREVRLVARWDVRTLSFSVDGGPRLVSKLADYYLATPRQPIIRKGKHRVAPLPRRGRRTSPPPLFDLEKSYEPHVRLFRRLLNLYVFARTHSIRGSYILEGGLDEDEDEDDERREASKVVGNILSRIKAEARARDLAWQDELPAFWREPIGALELHDPAHDPVHDLLVFRSLPDLPFVTPDIYKIVAPFFPRHMFRTDDVDQAERDKAREKRTTSTLVNKYRAVVQEDLETQDDPAESVGRFDVKTSPAFVNDRSLTDKVRTWKSAVVNDVTYRTGDIVVLPSPTEHDDLATTTRNISLSDVDAASDPGAASESESEHNREVEGDNSLRVWFAVVEYFFKARDENELRVHVSWFTVAKPIPSLGPYGSPRELFKLDRCDSPIATTISGLVDEPSDFRWLKPGEPIPRTGFYCGSVYSIDNGSIQDVSTLEPSSFAKCHKYGLIECASCESLAVYIDSTKDSDKDSQARYSKAVRGDGGDDALFVLDGTAYHRHDTVYIAFLEHDGDPKPLNVALPTSADPADAARTPWRLARLLGLEAPAVNGAEYDYLPGDEIVQVEVEWIVRAQELKLSRTSHDAYLSSHEVLVTTETEIVDAASLRGRFSLAFIDEDDSHLAETIATLEQSAANVFWTRARALSTVADQDFLNDSGVVTGRARREKLQKRDIKVCATCETSSMVKEARRHQLLQVDDLLLRGGALYSGGGLLDLGLEQGCSLLRTRVAVEKHRPALECLQSNFLSSPLGINKSVSDVNEAVYLGKETQAPEPGEVLFLSGGSPCQGFSRLNRFKTLDDLRCAEPFVFLTSLAVLRPLYAVYENVAAFHTHALPYAEPGHERGSFFKLFVAVVVALRYQVRWTIVNAAGYGVPQHRSRVIVQLAASGMRLPDAPAPSHAVKDARARLDHRLVDERDKKLEPSTEDGAPHAPISLFEALDDLPKFDIRDCYGADKSYVARPFGVEGKPSKVAKYGTIARTSFQLRCRTYLEAHGPAFSSGVTHHFCRSLSETVARRVIGIKIGGNHEHLKGKAYYPEPPPNVASNSGKLAKWWRRCTPGMILSPLRTTLSYDGSSQGERLHYNQLRPLSMRELLRVMGVPDAYELNFPSNVGDAAFDEQLRLIGNGVPVPLAAAFGRALEDALEPDVAAFLAAHPNAGKDKRRGGRGGGGTGNVWEQRWRQIGSEALCARSVARAPPGDEVRARRHEVGSGWAASSAASSSASPSPMRSGSSDEVASLLLPSHADRDETDRTSFESGVGGALDSPRRAQVKSKVHVVEVHGSDSESGSEGSERPRAARRSVPEVIDLCDSDSDSD
ncbi:hypothetical protein JCM9279_002126 [Rhodotorula babjevae]